MSEAQGRLTINWLSRSARRTSPPTSSDLPAEGSRPGHYFTDGLHLYRYLGEIPDGIEQMIGLEDCRSLDVMLLPVSELNAHGLHTVARPGAAAAGPLL